MKLLFKVEEVFDICGRGCVVLPAVPEDLDFRIRAKDRIQLRTPDGQVIDTQIASIELAKQSGGRPCRMAIMLPRSFSKQDIPTGSEIWHLEPS